jgi:hypothetical protein
MEMIKLMKMIKMMKLPFLPSSSMVSSLPTPSPYSVLVLISH